MTIIEIVNDFQKIARSMNVSSSENLSIWQIASWVNEYRAKLIRQAIDKGDSIANEWSQDMNCLELELVDRAECPVGISLTSGQKVQRTKMVIPSMINTKSQDGLIFIGSIEGKPYQYVTDTRARYMRFKKYSGNDKVTYRKGDYIYLTCSLEQKYLSLSAIFEDPLKLAEYYNTCSNSVCFDPYVTNYPITLELLPVIKDMIFKNELGITLNLPSDKHNDDQNILTANEVGGQRK